MAFADKKDGRANMIWLYFYSSLDLIVKLKEFSCYKAEIVIKYTVVIFDGDENN